MRTAPSEGTNSALVLHTIRAHSSGLSDTEIRVLTAISPHQQVNQICHQLAAAGLTERRSGAEGPNLNLLADTVATAPALIKVPYQAVTSRAGSTPKNQADPPFRSSRLEFAGHDRTLFVITWSKALNPWKGSTWHDDPPFIKPAPPETNPCDPRLLVGW